MDALARPYLIAFVADNGGPLPHSTNAPFRGTKEGSCIAREVRKATFPKFKKASLTINYPFKI